MGLEEADVFRRVTFLGSEGPLEARLYRAPGALSAVLIGGGIGGEFDSPARGLYHRLSRELVGQGVSALWLRYRLPTDLDEAVKDVLAGVRYLVSSGAGRVGLLGHSFGGAVMIAAASRAPQVTTVVALAPQLFGTEDAPLLSPRSLLLVHGTGDTILPPSSSRAIYAYAREPKALQLLEGAGHGLEEAAEAVYGIVREWLLRELGAGPGPERGQRSTRRPSASGRTV